jgi:hypothetical protein
LIFIDIYWYLLIFIDIYWYLLIFIDIYWYLLIFIDIYRYFIFLKLPPYLCTYILEGIDRTSHSYSLLDETIPLDHAARAYIFI